jgi:hypothetical protein
VRQISPSQKKKTRRTGSASSGVSACGCNQGRGPTNLSSNRTPPVYAKLSLVFEQEILMQSQLLAAVADFDVGPSSLAAESPPASAIDPLNKTVIASDLVAANCVVDDELSNPFLDNSIPQTVENDVIPILVPTNEPVCFMPEDGNPTLLVDDTIALIVTETVAPIVPLGKEATESSVLEVLLALAGSKNAVDPPIMYNQSGDPIVDGESGDPLVSALSRVTRIDSSNSIQKEGNCLIPP